MTDLQKQAVWRIQQILKTNPLVMLNVKLMDHKCPIDRRQFEEYCKKELADISSAFNEISNWADALVKNEK